MIKFTHFIDQYNNGEFKEEFTQLKDRILVMFGEDVEDYLLQLPVGFNEYKFREFIRTSGNQSIIDEVCKTYGEPGKTLVYDLFDFVIKIRKAYITSI
jgi:hypothetical protein